jgi:hypothetical protein
MNRRSRSERVWPGVLMCLIAGLGAIGLSIHEAADDARFRSTAERTVGTVTRWESRTVTTRHKPRYGSEEVKTHVRTYPVAAFTYQGVTYEVQRDVSTRGLPIDTEVPILFQPSDPRQARFDDEEMGWYIPMFLVFGVGMLGMSVFFYLPSDSFNWRSLRSGIRLRLPRRTKRRESAPRLYLREHVPGRKLVLETGSPHRAWLLAGTAGFGLAAAVVAFDRGAPLAGLGLFVGTGVLLVLVYGWMTYRVTLSLEAVELRRGLRRQRLERSKLRGVRLEPEAPEPEDTFRLWLEPRAPAPAPIEALCGSFGGTLPEARARLGTLREALESLDLRLSGGPEAPAVVPIAAPAPAPAAPVAEAPKQVAVTRFFRPGDR